MPRIRLGGEARVRRDPAERGFAQQLLSWEPDGLKLRAETSRCRYFIFEGRYETAAWCEPRELGAWRLRIEIGLFTSPEFAMVRARRMRSGGCGGWRLALFGGGSVGMFCVAGSVRVLRAALTTRSYGLGPRTLLKCGLLWRVMA